MWTADGRWRIVRCRGCGLLITWPRPDVDELSRTYGSPSYYEARGMRSGSGAAWAARAQGILSRLPHRPQRVLDIGAGNGDLVAALRADGVEAFGVEPSSAGREASRERYHLDLWPAMPIAHSHAFDTITLVHSLEHMPDPVEALVAARTLLAAGGTVFIEVPHAGSIEMWRPAQRRKILDLPVHLYHFTPETLALVLRRSGLELLETNLMNPDIVEWAMGIRARWRTGDHSGSPGQEPLPAMTGSPASARRGRAEVFLGRLRQWYPGWKFQAIARDPEFVA